jgi:hypothetical protein
VIAEGGRCVAGSNVMVPRGTGAGGELLVARARAAATRSASRESGPKRGRGTPSSFAYAISVSGLPTCARRSPESIVSSGATLARTAGLLTPAPSAPCSDACTMLSTSESSRRVAKARSVLPFAVSVQTSSFLPQSAGTRTLNTKRLRRGRKCVGWP